MVSFFIRRIQKNAGNDNFTNTRVKCVAACSFFGIGFNVLLFIMKLVLGMITHSIAIQSDAINNLSDAFSSVVTLIGIRISSKKPDQEHPFGHGRVEYLSALAVSSLILLMGFELAKESLTKIFHAESISYVNPLSTSIILLIAILIKCYMWYYNRKIGNELGSSAMTATALDSLSDAAASAVVLICSWITYFSGLTIIDGICGLFLSLFIFTAGFRSAKETLLPLLGSPPDPKLIKEVERIVLSHEPIIGIHDIIVHDYGPNRLMISLHAEVPMDSLLSEIHDVIDNVENELKSKLRCDATIHCDPIDTDNPETLRLKNALHQIIENISNEISIHDFRVVHGNTHTNLIFDLLLPFQVEIPEEEICKTIRFEILKQFPQHFCIIQIDRNFCETKK
jgi:cation diffusion facilitator family transporter